MTTSKGIRAADDLMRKLVQVPKAELSQPTAKKKKKRK